MDWTVRLRLTEASGSVVATATLVDEDEGTLSATGQFRPVATGPATPTHYEMAAARALQRLSDALIAAATRST
jgi:acyl-CoA thioesterase FadM